MPGESRGTLRAAPCACVELISSPPPLYSPLPSSPSFAFPSAGSTRGEHGVPRDLAPLPLRAHLPSSPHRYVSPSASLFLFLLTSPSRDSLFLPLVVSSSFSSLRGIFAFLRCCVLYSRYWYRLIKLSYSSFLFPRICLHLCPVHSFPRFIPFLSSDTVLLLLFIGLSTFYVLRLIFPI